MGIWLRLSAELYFFFFYIFSCHGYFVLICLYASVYTREKKTNLEKIWYFFFKIVFDCLNSYKIFCLNARNIRLSLLKKKKKNFFLTNIKTWRLNHSHSVIFKFSKFDIFFRWSLTIHNWLVKIWHIVMVQKIYQSLPNIIYKKNLIKRFKTL